MMRAAAPPIDRQASIDEQCTGEGQGGALPHCAAPETLAGVPLASFSRYASVRTDTSAIVAAICVGGSIKTSALCCR